ncbi:MAG TPA: hypothetical protein VN721_09715 [Flavipsychrobacter sp.]|nr:hypothetical protein [Flavipsychrobacter sp.]
MEITERDDKYFLKLSNGELELTEKQVQSLVERGAVIRNSLRNWIEKFSHRQWQVKKVPNTAEAFIKADEFFDNIIREFQEMFLAANNQQQTGERMLEFCGSQVQKLRKERDGSKDHPFADYQILCWLRIISFIKSMTSTRIVVATNGSIY